jgi:hypothetical protein
MDYATIATTAIMALSPFVVKGLEKISEKAAEEGFDQRKAIWEKVKDLFRADDLTLLNLLQEGSADAKAQGKLETHLEANPDIARELEALLSNLPASEIKQNTITQTGNDNFAAQDIQGSTITINK